MFGLFTSEPPSAPASGKTGDLSHVEVRRGVGIALQNLEKLPTEAHVAIAVLLVVAISTLDVLTGNEVNLSIFYLLPVAWATWFVGPRTGIATALISAITWSAVERVDGTVYSTVAVSAWNAIARLTLLFFTAILLAEIRQLAEMRRSLAYTDPLTGIANTRILEADLESEIVRLRRYGRPFAFAYLDLDHFKSVNDTLGHQAGDDLLLKVATSLASSVRSADIVARLGGDEFAVLMPETDEEDALAALGRIIDAVNIEVRAVTPKIDGLGMTVGAMVFTKPPCSADHVIRLADELMYDGKRSGRGVVRLQVYDAE